MANAKNLLFRGVALGSVLGLALTACSSGDGGSTVDPDDPACEAYADYQGHDGTTVSIYTPITDTEADLLEESWSEFEACTGITISYEGTNEFEAQLRVRVQGGNAPDIAFVPQPGLVAELASDLVPAPDAVAELAETNWSEGWMDYTTVDGTFYGAPLGSNMKSLVWYAPPFFSENGYEVPETWDELISLSETIAARGDMKPWCAGIGAGDATGWAATDWIEDMMLRLHGPDVYQQWIDHEIPFNDPKVVEAFDYVGEILRNEDFVNGGYNGPQSIATTTVEDGGLPILDGTCALHRQASFYAAQWPDDVTIAEDGDIYAFYLPVVDPNGPRPVLGAADFVVAFADRPEVAAVQTYLATGEWAERRAELGGWASANNAVDLNAYADPIQRLTAETLRDPEAVLAFDASDMMPGNVGAGSFWSEITEWITGQDTKTTVDSIEDSWPAS